MDAILANEYPSATQFLETNTSSMILQFITIILALIFVIFLAYISLRLVGGARNIRKGTNIRTIEAVSVGNQSNIQLISAGGKFFLIGVSRMGITLISEIPKEDINIEERPIVVVPFEKHLSKFFKREQPKDDQN